MLNREYVEAQMKYALAFLLLLAGCRKPLSNEQIVKQSDFCASHNMRIIVRTALWDALIYEIQCYPNPQKGEAQ